MTSLDFSGRHQTARFPPQRPPHPLNTSPAAGASGRLGAIIHPHVCVATRVCVYVCVYTCANRSLGIPTTEAGRMKTEQVVLELLYKAAELVVQSRVNLQSEADHRRGNRRARVREKKRDCCLTVLAVDCAP